MSKYNVFLVLFIAGTISMIVFFVFYLQAMAGFMLNIQELTSNREHISPSSIFKSIFTPEVIISFIIMALSNLALRIAGIVHVARNKTAASGEKAIWIVGFVLLGFITSIVFLIMAKSSKFV
ncbi:MAG: hypothetical protein V4556_05450 [Bacteroidota bacterium]